MTTIAWKDGVLACDSQATDMGTRSRAKSKLVLTDDYAYAVTGSLAFGLDFVRRLESGEEDPELKKATVVRMDRRTGQIVVFDPPGYPIPVEDKLFATGSGGDLALGAMAAGASAEEAVRIAIAWDADSGFGVQVVESDRAKRRRKK